MTASRYMLTSRFRALSIMPGADVDTIEGLESGWLQIQLDQVSGWLESRLAKRYALPFGNDPEPGHTERSDVPMAIENWLVALVTPRAYAKRGVNPSSGELWFNEMVIEPYKNAMAEVKEAADPQGGSFDLPLLDSAPGGGNATKSGPLVYNEVSPYVWTDVQLQDGFDDDQAGEGS